MCRLLTILFLAAVFGLSSVAARPAADLAIIHGRVVTMNDRRELLENADVVIQGARIAAVGVRAAEAYDVRRAIDARGGIVLPGMINTHTHVSMTVFRGLGDDVPDRLKRFIFPLEKNFVDADVVYWGGLHGMVEMVAGGVTTFADMYYFEEQVARAAKQIGLRGVLGETIVNFPAPDAPQPYGGFERARKFIADFHGDPLVTPAFAPHAPYTVDAEHLRAIGRAAAELDAPVLMHVAEMKADEIDALRAQHNQTPVEYLDSLGVVNRRLVAAHCIFVTDSDIALLKQRDAGVAHAIVANLKSAKGVAPVLKMLRQDVRVGLATDGPMSGNTLDIIGQLGYVAKVHKLANADRNVMPAADVVALATRGGARALHLEDRLGSLEPGKIADVIVVSVDSPRMIPLYDMYSALVYAATPDDVRTTIVNGRVLMDDRRITTVDAGDVAAHMRAIAARFSAAMK